MIRYKQIIPPELSHLAKDSNQVEVLASKITGVEVDGLWARVTTEDGQTNTVGAQIKPVAGAYLVRYATGLYTTFGWAQFLSSYEPA